MQMKLEYFDSSKHNVRQVAELIECSDEIMYRLLFGSKEKAIDIIEAMLVNEQNETLFSPPHTQCIMDEGRLVGVVVSYKATKRKTLEKKTFSIGLRKLGFLETLKRMFIIRKVRRLHGCEMSPESLYVLTLSLREEEKGKGYGSKTLKKLQEDCQTLYLHVNYRNNDARTFYEKIGFEKCAEYYDNHKGEAIGSIVLKRDKKNVR